MSFKTVSALLRGQWLIDKAYAESHLPFVARLIKGEGSFPEKDKQASAGAVNIKYSERGELLFPCATGIKSANVVEHSWYTGFSMAPQGSIALIPISGPILKYGDMCSYGSVHYTQWIEEAASAPNISGIILVIDSPGGQVDGTATLADAIKAAGEKKPVVALIDDGMMASAALWIGVHAGELYASQPTDTIGSIGVYTTLMDWKSYFEKEGLPIHDIYAPQSTDKNRIYKEAMKGEYAGVQEELTRIADRFISVVKEQRGSKLNTESENPFTGKMYPADQAQQIGLIDGQKSYAQVIARIVELASSNFSQNQSSKSATQMFNKFKNVSALANVEAPSQDQLDAANANLVEQGITAVTLVSDADLAAAQKATEENLTLVKGLAEAKAANEKLIADLAAEKKAFEDFKAGAGENASRQQAIQADETGASETDKLLTATDKEARARFNARKK